MKSRPVQQNFLAKLFSKPKPVSKERLSMLRKKIKKQIFEKEQSIKATENILEINRVSMGSSERAVESTELASARKRLGSLQKRFSIVSSAEKKFYLEKLKRSLKSNKFLVFPEKKFNDEKSKKLVIDFTKKFSFYELQSVCSNVVGEDWERIFSNRHDILMHDSGKSRHFARSANNFLSDVYRISQELFNTGILEKQNQALNLFVYLERLIDKIN